MGAFQKTSGESDVTILVVTGRSNGNELRNLESAPSYQSYSSTLFSLHRNALCDGPRRSVVLKALFGMSGHQARLEIDMSQEEAEALPRLVDYIYHGTPMPTDDKALTNLAKRFEVSSEPVDSPLESKLVVSSTKQSSPQVVLEVDDEESPHPEPPAKVAQPLAPIYASNEHPDIQPPTKKARQAESTQALPVVMSKAGNETIPQPNKLSMALPSLAKKAQPKAIPQTRASFQCLPNLLRDMRSDCEETKRQAEASLRTLLTVPKGGEHEMADIVSQTGSVSCVLEILSGDQYATLHLAAVELLNVVAKVSEPLASHLEKSLVVEKMLECQLFCGLEVRSGALEIMTSIAKHSENLCRQVLNRRGCLQSVLVACDGKETADAALLLLCQFCELFPQQMSRELGVFRTIKERISILVGRQQIYEAATSSCVKLLNTGLYVHQTRRDLFDSLFSTISQADDTGGGNYARRGRHAVYLLTHVVHKRLIFNHFFEDDERQKIPPLFWSPCKQVQARGCALVLVLVKSLHENKRFGLRYQSWCLTNLLPPLVKFLAREGTCQVPATMACTELILYSDLVARSFVEMHGIPLLCDLLDSNLSATDDEELKTNILLALQRLLEIDEGALAAPDADDVLHSVATNLSRVMLGGG